MQYLYRLYLLQNCFPVMESKYRRLYLYASNSKAVTKKPSQTIDDYKLKKQKSIEHLKQLLDIKIGLPPVNEIIALEDKLNQDNKQSIIHQVRQPKILKNKPKLDKILANHTFMLLSPDYKKNSPPLTINYESIAKEKAEKRRLKEEEKEKIYEKYINQYMEKIEKEKLLEKFPDKDYSILVQQACEEIRKRMSVQHLEISQVQHSLQQSRQQLHQILKKPKNKKGRIFSQIKIKNSEHELEPASHGSSFLAHIADKILLRRNEHRKSKSVADNNILKLNLELVERKNDLKNKVRKRSEKQFVRNLTRHSFLESIPRREQQH